MASSLADGFAPAGASLDLHEGIDDPRGSGKACERWPEHLRLLNERTGELVIGRCRATNLCDYCARLFAVETSEMLLLDAMEDAPALYAVLTARELLTRSDCRRHLTQLRKALKARWPAIRWAVLIEFTQGRSRWSGGHRRMHLNLLIKGVPVEDEAELHARMSAIWCNRVDAEPVGQWVGAVNEGAGLVRYVSQHFMKPAQAPPKGWRGHRYSATRDYLVRPASVMREEARRSLRVKRLVWRGQDAMAAELEVAVRADEPWSLRHVSPSPKFVAERDGPSPARSIAAEVDQGTSSELVGGGASLVDARRRPAGCVW